MQTKSEMINRIAELAKENAELEAELQNFKDMAKKGLDEFKDVGGCWGCGLQLELNHDMEDIKQLKAENERLKEEINKLGKKHEDYCNIMYWQMKEQMDKYRQTLQEIKDIAENKIDCKQYEIDHDCFNDTRCKALRELIETLQQILDLITKAEEE